LTPGRASPGGVPGAPPAARDELAAAIARVDAELEAALGGLDGWAEGVLARERARLRDLRTAWLSQAERIREMDRVLALPDDAGEGPPGLPAPASAALADRLRSSSQARRENIERLRRLRRRAHDDLTANLARVR